jgi:hypothetical protein
MRRLTIILLFIVTLMPMLAQAGGPDRPRRDRQALYKRYAARTELAVAQVEGFKLNDSVKVDVLILVADDAAGWQKLCKEFDIRNASGVATWTGKNDHPEVRMRWQGKPCCKVIASPARRTVCMYFIDDSVQYESLMDYQMNLMMNK